MQTIKTNGREIVAVEVPAYVSMFYLSTNWYLCHTIPNRDFVYTKRGKPIVLPECKIIGLLSELTAEQCEPYVQWIHVEYPPSASNDMCGSFDYAYIDYNNVGDFAGYGGDAGCYKDAKDSFVSLLQSHSLDTKSPLLIIEKIK